MDEQKRMYVLGGLLFFAIIVLVVVLVFTGDDEDVEVANGNGEEEEVFSCGDSLEYHGHSYSTVEIGDKCWFAENLRTDHYRDESEIQNLIPGAGEWSEDEEGAYVYYQNQEENAEEYGALYNFYAVENDAGLCPQGWSVPTNEEWAEMEKWVCEDLGNSRCEEEFDVEEDSGWRGNDEADHLKKDAENTYGLSITLGGFRNANGPFSLKDEDGFYWTSTADNDLASARIFAQDNEAIRRIETARETGASVRCVK